MEITSKEEINTKIEQKQRQFVTVVAVFILFNYFASMLVYYFIGSKLLGNYNLIMLIVASYIYYLFTKVNIKFESLVSIVLISYVALLYIQFLLFGDIIPTIILWFFILPLIALVIKSFKWAFYLAILVIVLYVIRPIVSHFLFNLFDFQAVLNTSSNIRFVMNDYQMVGPIIFIAIIVYYFMEFNKLKTERLLATRAPVIHPQLEPVGNIVNREEEVAISRVKKNIPENSKKFDELYERIEKYFEEKRPYKDPDFNINKLAVEVKSNTSYISKAMNYKRDMSFNAYLNNYRIQVIKAQLIKKEHEKYTLKHIYTNAGFSQQTTFNRAFKEVEGITPSEFIERLA